jgi:cytochrome P450
MGNSISAEDTKTAFTISDPSFYLDPFPDYEWMMEKPVWRDPATGFWVVTRYQDVRTIAMHPQLWSSNTNQIFTRISSVTDQVNAIYEKDGWLPIDTLVTNDPPDHKRYRTLVDKAFSPGRVKQLLPFIDSIATGLIEKVVEKGRCDFVQEFSIPMAITVISNQTGGAGPEDIPQLRKWAEGQLELIDPVLSPERELELTHEAIDFQRWLSNAIDRVSEADDGTILSGLITAEVNGERLNKRELIAIALQFYAAGHDTTTSAVTSIMFYLGKQPELLAALKAAPEKIPAFVEEILRLEGPVQRLFRRATSDTKIGDVDIKAGEIAVIQWGGANRDGEKFPAPKEVNLDRKDITSHMSFGTGIHFCVGNQLARAELNAAVRAIVTRCGTITLPQGDASITYHKQFISRAPASLEVIVTPA